MAVCNTRNQKLGKKFGCFGNSQYFCKTKDRVRGRAEVARRAHNPEVAGSSPVSATMVCDQNRYARRNPRTATVLGFFRPPI